MALITLTDAQLAFGHVALLDHVELGIDNGERVGLIGRNGTGKSSLLRAIAGLVQLDDGLIQRASGGNVESIAYVPQEPTFDAEQTVFEAVGAGIAGDLAQLGEYEALTARLADAADPSDLLDRLHQLQVQLEASGSWMFKARVERVLHRLSLDASARIGTLSGGTQKRVALARALVCEPNLLLLDEPTNHLDLQSIEWLEELLLGFKGAVLFVTHDRRFLDRVATRIIELDRGTLRSYPGNFSAYQMRKAEQIEVERTLNEKFDRRLAQEEVWIRKGIEARRTRNEGRVRRLEALRRERIARRELGGRAQIGLSEGERSGRLVAELTHISKSFGEQKVVRDFSVRILRGDKVGLIGANGAGKTTLLRLILGELEPDSGKVRLGTNLQIAYFDQMRAQLDDEATLIETISPGSDWVEIDGKRTHVMSYLADFLFSAERARSPVRTLSGGERNRLLLARLFARPANVLVLDEPTNDLDIDTLELLEELLENYTGTIFLVSHDRAFLDNVVTQTIAAEGEGVWHEYVGGYAAYADYQLARRAASSSTTKQVTSGMTAPARASHTPKPRTRLSYKEQRELDTLPDRIAALEAEQRTITAQLGDHTIYRSDTNRTDAVETLNKRFASIDAELTQCLERWEALEARQAGVPSGPASPS